MKRCTWPAAVSTGVLLTLLLHGWGPGAADAALLEGQLRWPEAVQAPSQAVDPGNEAHWDQWNGVLGPRVQPARHHQEIAVVLLGNTRATGPRTEFAIRNGAFRPQTLVIAAGSQLEIYNGDPMEHQLWAEGLSSFTPISTAPGHQRRLQVDEEGSWPIRDRLYGHIQAHLYAFPNLSAIAELSADGRYRFGDVAPGRYTLKVLRGSEELASQSVDVEDTRRLSIDPILIQVQAAR